MGTNTESEVIANDGEVHVCVHASANTRFGLVCFAAQQPPFPGVHLATSGPGYVSGGLGKLSSQWSEAKL